MHHRDLARSDSLLLRAEDSGLATSSGAENEVPSCSDDGKQVSPPVVVRHHLVGLPPCGGAAGHEDRVVASTIKQHYYPEGGWGWLVLFCAVLVQCLAHGLHGAAGVLWPEVQRRFPRAPYMHTGALALYYPPLPRPLSSTQICKLSIKVLKTCSSHAFFNLAFGVTTFRSNGNSNKFKYPWTKLYFKNYSTPFYVHTYTYIEKIKTFFYFKKEQ